MKAIFVTMPLTLQSYVAEREQHRDTELRRMQNELAEAKRALAEATQSKENLQNELAEALKQITELKGKTSNEDTVPETPATGAIDADG
jgi:septal ring factor EnvC (AmiA/AmiB activator)